MKVYVGPASSLQGEVRAPSSKNYTSRYLWVSALTEGQSIVYFPAQNDDALALLSCCRRLGAKMSGEQDLIRIKGFGQKPLVPGTLDPGNGGLILRFLLAIGLFLPEVKFVTKHLDSLGKRPQGDLLKALRDLGAEVEDVDGHLPITIRGARPLKRRDVTLSGLVSSQFATALLMVAPLLGGLSLTITDQLSSRPPLATTLQVMREAGVKTKVDWPNLSFEVPGGKYQPGEYRVPGDYPAASALLAAAALLPSEVTLSNLYPDDQQGEKKIIPYLQQLGAKLVTEGNQLKIIGGDPLTAVDFYGDQAIDAVLSMAAIACYAKGVTRFLRVGNLRWKESDRIRDFARELKKIGVEIEAFNDHFMIKGNPGGYEGGVEIDTYQDHRMVMTFSVLALRTRKGLMIKDAEHVSKSYPTFFSDLASLGATVKVIAS
ncbi:MAG TPA: 3-phosphoshikimate 1-carboxyvinyltransferase [Firmicutes bacterium]|nr:3-phosphoshikimate 1-carboxyvinyltransferase [Bacillota bacterium]